MSAGFDKKAGGGDGNPDLYILNQNAVVEPKSFRIANLGEVGTLRVSGLLMSAPTDVVLTTDANGVVTKTTVTSLALSDLVNGANNNYIQNQNAVAQVASFDIANNGHVRNNFTASTTAAAKTIIGVTTGIANYKLEVVSGMTNLNGGYFRGGNALVANSALRVDNPTTELFAVRNNGNVNIPTTTAAGAGIITQNAARFIHSFNSSTNFFAGQNAGNLTLTGTAATAIGSQALTALTNGTNNTCIGRNSLLRVNSGGGNVAVGSNTGEQFTTHSRNTVIGHQAAQNSTSNDITVIGNNAATSVTGDNIIAIGQAAINNVTNSTNFVVIGTDAVGSATGSAFTNGTSLGIASGTNISTGGANSLFLGFRSGGNYTTENNIFNLSTPTVAFANLGTTQANSMFDGSITNNATTQLLRVNATTIFSKVGGATPSANNGIDTVQVIGSTCYDYAVSLFTAPTAATVTGTIEHGFILNNAATTSVVFPTGRDSRPFIVHNRTGNNLTTTSYLDKNSNPSTTQPLHSIYTYRYFGTTWYLESATH